MKITTTNKPDEVANQIIDTGLEEHAKDFSTTPSKYICIYCHDIDGKIIGGLLGDTAGNWLEIWQFWVNEDHRNNSWGSKILLAAEEEALKRGCKHASLQTFSFQVLEFYLKRGYQQFAVLEEYAGEYSRHFLRKRLGG